MIDPLTKYALFSYYLYNHDSLLRVWLVFHSNLKNILRPWNTAILYFNIFKAIHDIWKQLNFSPALYVKEMGAFQYNVFQKLAARGKYLYAYMILIIYNHNNILSISILSIKGRRILLIIIKNRNWEPIKRQQQNIAIIQLETSSQKAKLLIDLNLWSGIQRPCFTTIIVIFFQVFSVRAYKHFRGEGAQNKNKS